MSAKKISRSRRAVKKSLAGDPFAGSSGADATMLLALAAPVVRGPSPAVKNALLARIRAEKPASTAAEGWRFAKFAAGENWVNLPLPGLRMRELTIDTVRDTALLFVEMAPGAKFPDHDHSATERGLVLSGDLRMGDRLLAAGDFYEAAAGTRHERIASPSGCTGLLWVGADAWQRWQELAVAR
jgi:hypothetical protein